MKPEKGSEWMMQSRLNIRESRRILKERDKRQPLKRSRLLRNSRRLKLLKRRSKQRKNWRERSRKRGKED